LQYKHERRFFGAAILRGLKGASKAAKSTTKSAKSGYRSIPSKGPVKGNGGQRWSGKKSKKESPHKDDKKQEAECRADGELNYWNCILYYAKKGEKKLRGGK
jgi:hypothetical protein